MQSQRVLTHSFYFISNQKPNRQSAPPSLSFDFETMNIDQFSCFKLWEQWAKSAWQKVKGQIMPSSQDWGQEEGLPPCPVDFFHSEFQAQFPKSDNTPLFDWRPLSLCID